MKVTLYKWTDETGCTFGGFQWPLPHDDEPGDWVPALEGEIVPCANGYHVCLAEDIVDWINARLFVIEAMGETIRAENKTVCRGPCRLVREITAWNETIARLFACDCAERVLPIYERAYPGDGRLRNCIATTREYVAGLASATDWAAAWDAARAATWDTAWDATWDAAAAATWDAAWDATRAAARDAAGAAGDAAWDAAQAAWNAGDAAWTAGNAAWDAAWNAEREWQRQHLLEMCDIVA